MNRRQRISGNYIMKTLNINEDYASIFGLNNPGQKMIYNGGISWTAEQIVNGESKSMTMESQETTDSALAYINKQSINMGKF